MASEVQYSITDDWNALYLNGEWVDTEDSISVEDPSTRETVTDVPAATESDVDAAYEAAARAQPAWAETPPMRREKVIQEFARALEKHRDEIIELLKAEVGGGQIMGETSMQIALYHAGEAATYPRRLQGQHKGSNIPGKENIVEQRPAGVVTAISPWNFPLNLSLRAVAPAIVTGNSVVLKPATNSAITGGLLFAKLFEDALPKQIVGGNTDARSVAGASPSQPRTSPI